MVSLVSRITFIDDRISSSTSSSFLIVIEFRFVIFVLDEIPNNHLFHSFFHFRRQFLFVRVKRKNERTRFGRIREKKEDPGGRGEGRELVNNVNEKSVDERSLRFYDTFFSGVERPRCEIINARPYAKRPLKTARVAVKLLLCHNSLICERSCVPNFLRNLVPFPIFACTRSIDPPVIQRE